MIVEKIVEHEDGGATITMDLTEEERQMLIEHALLDILTKATKEVIEP
jgi:hypothetical protein